ncbi:hypothetical protein [Paenibacillus agri]|uniref:Uncharacterized protein n=1 Tax=Paenibacillus agri TaxID=2744309 RepID=A0A850EHP4_9BACL|nr:hypothetical protein [Paenibacillus agri]NUU59209.1 hypothetical protein [Paenibacillus agri]
MTRASGAEPLAQNGRHPVTKDGGRPATHMKLTMCTSLLCEDTSTPPPKVTGGGVLTIPCPGQTGA